MAEVKWQRGGHVVWERDGKAVLKVRGEVVFANDNEVQIWFGNEFGCFTFPSDWYELYKEVW